MWLHLRTIKVSIFYYPFSNCFCLDFLGTYPEVEISGHILYWENVPKRKEVREGGDSKPNMFPLEFGLMLLGVLEMIPPLLTIHSGSGPFCTPCQVITVCQLPFGEVKGILGHEPFSRVGNSYNLLATRNYRNSRRSIPAWEEDMGGIHQ